MSSIDDGLRTLADAASDDGEEIEAGSASSKTTASAPTSATSLESIPAVLVQMTLQNLLCTELLRVARCSRRLRADAATSFAWIRMTSRDIYPFSLVHLSRASLARDYLPLRFQCNRCDADDLTRLAAAQLAMLREVKISVVPALNTPTADLLAAFLGSTAISAGLRSLTLGSSAVLQADFNSDVKHPVNLAPQVVTDALSQLQGLTHLSLHRRQLGGDFDLTGLQSLPRLRSVEAHEHSEYATFLPHHWIQFAALRHLTCFVYGRTEDQMHWRSNLPMMNADHNARLEGFLRSPRGRSLETLHLLSTQPVSEGVLAALGELTGLKNVALVDCEQPERMLTPLAQLASLRRVALTHCRVTSSLGPHADVLGGRSRFQGAASTAVASNVYESFLAEVSPSFEQFSVSQHADVLCHNKLQRLSDVEMAALMQRERHGVERDCEEAFQAARKR